ncbi:ATPase family associated with various cellular activities (AAA) [Methylobacterium sp. 275MFSha3.1]|uniref:AAA family ATPase n=1 Tax=Methylobacterium sp. 275MFSha3.1 TaxID=1502746 RepID=UPI0008A7B330|nr:AAA family ATPase [Methylobacterium sp. 275MFSha3.1]SEI10163.1 ATPase family associated with various cellular activities (AAA) [Methylobacterium sp. 275MFSha3.1]
MAFTSTPPALQIDSEAARRLLEPMLPRRLRACLAQDLRVASACSELALEITTLAPDAEVLVSAWIAAAADSDGALWRDRRWIARRSNLIRFLDVLAVERDQPAARALADVATLLSCGGDDRRAAARLAQPLWLEREGVLELGKQFEALAEAQTRLGLGRVAGPDADIDLAGATDLAVALQRAWHDAFTDALLTLSEKASSAIAAAAALACGADDAFAGDVALVHALVPVGEILTRPVADSAATRERRRWKKLEAQFARNEARREEATVETAARPPDADVPRVEVPEGYVLVVPRIQETGSDRGRSIARGYEHIIGKPLPLVAVPDLAAVRARLAFEFPYALAMIDRLLADLIGREHATFRPTLLIGPPGAGKSRLVARIAHHLGLGLWRVDATRDAGASLGGLDRRWATSEPAHPIMAVARAGTANPLMLIDELEKAATRADHGRLWDALLPMLEPETARTYQDPCFQAETDISRVSWLATANAVGNLPGPLLDRLRVLEMPAPRTADLEALVEPILAGIAADRGLDPAFITPLDGEAITLLRMSWRGGSVRRLIRLVEVLVTARETLAVRQ